MERLCSIIDSYKGMYIPLYDQWTARKSCDEVNYSTNIWSQTIDHLIAWNKD